MNTEESPITLEVALNRNDWQIRIHKANLMDETRLDDSGYVSQLMLDLANPVPLLIDCISRR